MRFYSTRQKRWLIIGIALLVGISLSFAEEPSISYAAAKPGKVKIISVKAKGKNAVSLTWEKTKRAKGYEIYRAKGKSKEFQKIKTISNATTLRCKDKKLDSFVKYRYQIRAFGKGENNFGPYSRQKSVKVKGPLAKPQIKEAKAISSSSVLLGWKKVPGAKGYQIFRAEMSGEYKKVKTIKKNKTLSFTDTKLKANTKYKYKVRAFRYKKSKQNKEKPAYGKYSLQSAVITKEAPPKDDDSGNNDVTGEETEDLLGGPSEITLTAGTNAVSLQWSAVDNVTGYEVYKTTTTKSGGIASFSATPIMYVKNARYCDTDVEPGKTYYYKVIPYKNKDGVGTFGYPSAVVKADIPLAGEEVAGYNNKASTAPSPAMVTGLTALYENNAVRLSWKKEPRAFGYRILKDGEPFQNTKEASTTDDAVTLGATHVYSVCTVYNSFQPANGRLLGKFTKISVTIPYHEHVWSEVKERTVEYHSYGIACPCGYCTNDGERFVKQHLAMIHDFNRKLFQDETIPSFTYEQIITIGNYLGAHSGNKLNYRVLTLYPKQTYQVCTICGKEKILTGDLNGEVLADNGAYGYDKINVEDEYLEEQNIWKEQAVQADKSYWEYLVEDCGIPRETIDRIWKECPNGEYELPYSAPTT